MGIESDINIVNFFQSDLKTQAFIPDVRVINSSAKPIVKIEHRQSIKQSINYIKKSKTYLIYDDWSKTIPIYIVLFIYKLFHDNYINKKTPFLVFHASAVTKGNKNIGIIAHTGAGKTTIMLELISKHGYKMISNNKTVYCCRNNYCSVLSGTKGISIRTSLLEEIPKSIEILKQEEFIQRKIVSIHKRFLAYKFMDGKQNIIVIPQLNRKFCRVIEMDKKEATYYLFPMAMELMHREVLFFGAKQICPMTSIGDDIRKNILLSLKKLIKSSEIYQISGNLNFICRTIKKL
ncbi:MAG: hypothetical protein V1656_03435 [Candidatus Jorgensenbacteria bacterium]